MAQNPEFERLAKAQESMDGKIDKILEFIGSHDRTLYGTDGDRKTGLVQRINVLENSEDERNKRTIKAALGIAILSLGGGGVAAKFDAIKSFLLGQ